MYAFAGGGIANDDSSLINKFSGDYQAQ